MDTTYNINGGSKPTIKRFADLDGPDFFPTPAWATQALIDNEPFDGTIWELVCGVGSMAEVLKLTGNPVVCTDPIDRRRSGTTAYAWFVSDTSTPAGTELKWFRPGHKVRGA